MLLKKLADDHYVVADTSEIKEGDYIINVQRNHIYPSPVLRDDVEYRNKKSDVFKKVTHSTKPIECDKMWTPLNGKDWICNTLMCCCKILNPKIKHIDLFYVKELLGEVDVEKKVKELMGIPNYFLKDIIGTDMLSYLEFGIECYNQCLEDNKDKRFSEEDIQNAWAMGYRGDSFEEMTDYFKQPKDTWEVEFDENGNLKLK